jgi:hypothetical protein
MKRVLLIGIILAILILAMPQGVSAATSSGGAAQAAEVTATIADYITLVVTGPASTWMLNFDNNPVQCDSDAKCNQLNNAITFAISSNDGWTLSAVGDNSGNIGFLKTSESPFLSLVNRLKIGPNPTAAYVTVETTKTLQTGTLGVTPPFTKNLQQTLAITDDATRTYHLTLTFDATTNA